MSNSTMENGNPKIDEKYRHIYVIIEHFEGLVVPVSLEMLGEARRLMDNFNQKYDSTEKVVAVVLGSNVRNLCDELVTFGADCVIYANHEELKYPRNDIDTRLIAQIAKDTQLIKEYPQNIRTHLQDQDTCFSRRIILVDICPQPYLLN